MKTYMLVCISFGLLLGCDSQKSNHPDSAVERISTENFELIQKQRAEICVNSAMLTISGEPRDNYSVLSRVKQADLSACPGDFSGEFVGMRQVLENAIKLEEELARHQQESGNAVAGSLAVSFAEWLLNADSGLTPFKDWIGRDTALSRRTEEISTTLRSQFQALQRSAARYGYGANGQVALLVRGTDPQGAVIYAFVLMTSEKATEFMNAQRTGQIVYPENFGKIILSGSGEPTDQDYAQMKRDYNFDRTAMSDVH